MLQNLPPKEQISRMMAFLNIPNVQLPIAELKTALPENLRESTNAYFLYKDGDLSWIVEDNPENVETGAVTDPGVIEKVIPVLVNGLRQKCHEIIIGNIAEMELNRALCPEALQQPMLDPETGKPAQ